MLEHSRMQIVHQTNARVRKCTCRSDRASRLLCAQMRSHWTPVDQNACSMCSDALSLDARQSKCVSYVLRCALARRLPIHMRFIYAQMRSRSTPVYPFAFPMCSDVLSLDACLSKCISYVLRCALKRSEKCPCPSRAKKVNPLIKKRAFPPTIFQTLKAKKIRCHQMALPIC